jgi:heme exporter protein D
LASFQHAQRIRGVGEDPGCGQIDTESRDRKMWIVAIAWMYVTLMMALAEATNPQGTVLGAVFTFLLYGVGPLALVLYLMGAPARRKAILQAEREALARQQAAPRDVTESPEPRSEGVQADGGSLPTAAPISPMREEPPSR